MIKENPRLSILHICDQPPRGANANAIRDSIDAFCAYSKHEVFIHSEVPNLVDYLDLNRFDALVIHYSISVIGDGHASRSAKRAISEFKGLKIQFIQDEYRRVNAAIDQMRDLGIDLLFTCLPEEEIEKVYSPEKLPRLTAVSCLTAYVPNDLLTENRPTIATRNLNLGYRTRKPWFWLGSLSVEKWKIVDDFLRHAEGKGLKLDLSYREEDRIYGDEWIEFIKGSKAVLGVESGSSVFDFTGEIQLNVENYQRRHPEASFEEVRDLFFKEEEGRVRLNVISARCFEAACLGSVMVLYEGSYSGILKPWRHYIPLKKDFSNFDEVVSILKDDEKLQEIADRTYDEIAASGAYSYQKFVESFDGAVDRKFIELGRSPTDRAYSRFEYRLTLVWFRVTEVAAQYYYFMQTKLRSRPHWNRPSVVIFGAGKGGENAYRNLGGRVRVVAFCDNDARKQGMQLCGKPIVNPRDLDGLAFDFIWVASLYSGEIYRQLMDSGMPREKVKVAGDEMITPLKLPYPRAVAAVVGIVGVVVVSSLLFW